MPASNTSPARENRFAELSPACLSKSEKSSVVALALKVLAARYRPGRAFSAPEDIQRFLRLKLSGRRNEVFGIIFLDTRHRSSAWSNSSRARSTGRPCTRGSSCRRPWTTTPRPS